MRHPAQPLVIDPLPAVRIDEGDLRSRVVEVIHPVAVLAELLDHRCPGGRDRFEAGRGVRGLRRDAEPRLQNRREPRMRAAIHQWRPGCQRRVELPRTEQVRVGVDRKNLIERRGEALKQRIIPPRSRRFLGRSRIGQQARQHEETGDPVVNSLLFSMPTSHSFFDVLAYSHAGERAARWFTKSLDSLKDHPSEPAMVFRASTSRNRRQSGPTSHCHSWRVPRVEHRTPPPPLPLRLGMPRCVSI